MDLTHNETGSKVELTTANSFKKKPYKCVLLFYFSKALVKLIVIQNNNNLWLN